MPQNVTETEVWTTPLQAVADGDSVNGATWLAAIQGYANRLKYLAARVSGVQTEVITCAPFPAISGANYFLTETGSNLATGIGPMLQSGTPGSDPIAKCVWYNPPKKGTLTQVQLRVQGAWSSSTHAGLPSSMPAFKVFRWDPTTGASTQVGTTATDGSGTVGAYEAAHDITLSGLSESLEGRLYYIQIFGEDDTNALANSFAVIAMKFSVTPV